MKCVGRFSSIFSLINIFTLSITIVEKIVMSQLSAYAEMLIEILYHQKKEDIVDHKDKSERKRLRF